MGGGTPEVVGRYAVYDKIASGGMASVHFGRMVGGAGFSRTVAIKRLHPHLAEDPDFLSTMIDEARMAARIHHPNVVPTLDVVATKQELLLVMEYVRGESLSKLIRVEASADRFVPLPIVSSVAVGALQGLHAAHEATSDQGTPLGIVHRDVSPQNILVGVDGTTRVIDFGIAKAAGRLQTTREGVLKGKIPYMAPEQLARTGVTRAADVYAMGVVLWEMLTSRRLFAADSEVLVVKMVVDGPQESPRTFRPEVPAELDALVMKALSRHASDRFDTALEMAEAVARIVPPCLATEVGKWCVKTAGDALGARDSILAEIESGSGRGPGMPASSSSGKGGSEEVTIPSEPIPPTEREPQTAATGVSNVSIPVERTTSSTRRFVIGIAGVVALLVAFGVGVMTKSRPVAPPPMGSPSLGSAAPSSLSSSTPTAAPVASAVSLAPSAHTVGSSAPASGPAPAQAAPIHPPARSPAANGPATKAPGRTTPAKPGCNPEYYYDSSGNKHFKPDCFPE